MSSASTNLGVTRVAAGPDFWELSNFGANPVNLANYTFADDTDVRRVLVAASDPNPMIQPGESLLFVRSDPTQPITESQFRAWWGSCLSPNARVRLYPAPGFNANADRVSVYDAGGSLVGRVDFGLARRGVTFVYDTNSGAFGSFSALDECGACRAATADDIGSPGVACGSVRLKIEQQPSEQSICAGLSAVFTVRASGLPQVRYRWFRNNNIVPGAVSATLTITNAQPSDEGQFEVELDNGLTVLRSERVLLTVSTNPSPPMIATAPIDLELYPGQAARFSVTVCAFPPASYRWYTNGTPVRDATNRTLRLPDSSLSMSGMEFCVRITNEMGTAEACARLTVRPKPRLFVSEIMARSETNCLASGHRDWFELTNPDAWAVNLRGYRFFDQFILETAPVIAQPLVVGPGESVVFVDNMTPEAFIQWWGAERLPAGVQVVSYEGFGLDHLLGDTLYLWNAAAEDVFDGVTSLSLAGALTGVSVRYGGTDCLFGCDSEAGRDGAFPAVSCGDIGSPGYTTNPPPRMVWVERGASGVSVRWRALPEKTYQLKFKSLLTDASWTFLSQHVATDFVMTATDSTAGNAQQRFYRVEEMP